MRLTLIGAGTGQGQLLRGFRGTGTNVTAIVGVTDSGGNSGVLRRRLGIPAVGDVRNCLGAQARRGSTWERILTARFTSGRYDGMSIGNLVLATLTRSYGSIGAAADIIQRLTDSRARVVPVSDGSAQVGVVLESGRRVVGEWKVLTRRDRSRIRSVFHRPRLPARKEACRAVERCEAVVLCPGTLFTGVLSTAIAEGLREAILRTRASLVLVLNIMTQPGQTDGMTARDHVAAVEQVLGRRPDRILVNTGRPRTDHLRLYERLGARPVVDDLGRSPAVIRGDFVQRSGPREGTERGTSIPSLPHLIRHHPDKVVRALLRS